MKENKTMSDDDVVEKLPEQLEFLTEQLKKNPYDKKLAKEIAIAIADNVNGIRDDDCKRAALLILNYHQYAYGYVQPHIK